MRIIILLIVCAGLVGCEGSSEFMRDMSNELENQLGGCAANPDHPVCN